MKLWLGIRLLIILTISVAVYYILNYLVIFNLTFPPKTTHPFTVVGISLCWTLGLYTVKYQFDHQKVLPSQSQSQPNILNRLLDQNKDKTPESEPRTLGEIVQKTQGSPLLSETAFENPTIFPGQADPQKNNGQMGSMVEGVLKQSMADAEMDVTLELPEGTELQVFGQKVQVKKGQIKLKPRKTKDQKMNKLFGDKARKRRA